MGVQAQDLPFNLDSMSVLDRMSAREAETWARGIRASTFRAPDGPIHGRTPSRDDLVEFIDECRLRLADTVIALQRELRAASLVDCVALSILIGQDDKKLRMVTGRPNAFAYEIEFLASCAQRIDGRFPGARRRAQAAFNALRLAREHRILSGLLDQAQRRADADATYEGFHRTIGLSERLAEEWVSLRGSFDTRYDWAYSQRLAERITRRGVHHPSIAALSAILHNVMDRWSSAIGAFHGQVDVHDGQLCTSVRQHTLLDTPGRVRLSRRLGSLIEACAQRLIVSREELLAGPVRGDPDDMNEWLQLLTLDQSAIGRNAEARRVFESPLSTSPVVATRSGYLFALYHLPTTELSRLVEQTFKARPGLQYYRARAEELEASAISMIGGLFPGAQIMHGGKYRGDRAGELIEVDGVIAWHDIVLLIESKGGYLSTRSRRGEEAAAVADIRDTIGDGFFQATRLVRRIERDGHVELTDDDGDVLVLDARRLRRAYVVIPTADTFGSGTTSPIVWWRKALLPQGSLPLIVPIQELNLMTDLLVSPLEFVAYLDYREQILHNPDIQIADEGEMLGHFVGGNDILATVNEKLDRYSFALSQPESKNRRQMFLMGTDGQETYLNPWIQASSIADLRGTECPVPKPRRHSDADRAKIEEYFASTQNLAAASIMMQAPVSLGLLPDSPSVRRGAPAVRPAMDSGFVAYAVGDRVTTIRRLPTVRRFREDMRLMIYLQTKDSGLQLRHAEAGRRHPFFGDENGSLSLRSRLGEQADWFDEFARRRHGAHRVLTTIDIENRDTLIRAGMQESLATGVARLGLVDKVLDLAHGNLTLNQAADTYLTHVRKAAQTTGVPATDVGLSTTAIENCLELVQRGLMDRSRLATLLHLHLQNPTTPSETLARRAGLLSISDLDQMTTAIHAAVKHLGITPTSFARLGAKKQAKARKQVMGAIRTEIPAANMTTVAQLLDDYLGDTTPSSVNSPSS